MEFQEFCRQRNRMCDCFEHTCRGCPIYNDNDGISCGRWCFSHSQKAEQIVAQWAKEHPAVTNAEYQPPKGKIKNEEAIKSLSVDYDGIIEELQGLLAQEVTDLSRNTPTVSDVGRGIEIALEVIDRYMEEEQ